jgi:hypothetical protein
MRGWFIIFDELHEYRERTREFAAKVQAEMARPIPCWIQELRETPRRMKRPFPSNKPAKPPAHRRACY